MLRKRMLYLFVLIIVLIILSYVIGYVVAMKSEPYDFVVKFIRNNSYLYNNIGKLKRIQLTFFGYLIRYEGPHGYAEYKISVEGEKAKGKVYVNIEKIAGIWEIIKANLILNNGQTILLK